MRPSRLYVGLRDHRARKLRVLPAAGLAAATLRVRLPDVTYSDDSDDASDLGGDVAGAPALDAAALAQQKADLVHAFGSARR